MLNFEKLLNNQNEDSGDNGEKSENKQDLEKLQGELRELRKRQIDDDSFSEEDGERILELEEEISSLEGKIEIPEILEGETGIKEKLKIAEEKLRQLNLKQMEESLSASELKQKEELEAWLKIIRE